MKIPEPFFVVINPVMRFVLRSPLHGIFSNSFMLITFTGRKSGKTFTTPVRYIRYGDTVLCFSSAKTLWWRNLRGGASVVLRIRGRDVRHAARLIEDDASEVEKWLRHYLGIFPQDAVYHDIRLNPDNSLVEEDLLNAARHSIVVAATAA